MTDTATPSSPPANATPTDAIIARHDAHMSVNYPRYDIAMVRGEGSTLWDAEGKRYIDLFNGFGAGVLGHCHPALVDAVSQQAKKLWHVGNLFHTEPQTLLAEAIAKHGFGGKSFFCHSGADANEAAIKLARLYGRANPAKNEACGGAEVGRYKIITTHNSFHGRTLATIVATGQPKVREGFDPLPGGFAHVPYNDLDAMEKMIDPQTVAIMVEPIQGEGGVNVPDQGYMLGLRRLCDEHDLLLICDEVWTGGGRTGRYFAYQHWGPTPDIMTLAKGVGGGLPVGVMCAKDRIAHLYDYRVHGGVAHATTLGGNCLSMAAAHAVFATLEREFLVDRAAAVGQQIVDRLQKFAANCEAVVDIRGKGLFLGIQLDPDKGWFKDGPEVVRKCMEHGLLINATQGVVLRLGPAVTISNKELDEGLGILERIIRG